jgi:Ca2+-binding RTX toxin-like protein
MISQAIDWYQSDIAATITTANSYGDEPKSYTEEEVDRLTVGDFLDLLDETLNNLYSIDFSFLGDFLNDPEFTENLDRDTLDLLEEWYASDFTTLVVLFGNISNDLQPFPRETLMSDASETLGGDGDGSEATADFIKTTNLSYNPFQESVLNAQLSTQDLIDRAARSEERLAEAEAAVTKIQLPRVNSQEDVDAIVVSSVQYRFNPDTGEYDTVGRENPFEIPSDKSFLEGIGEFIKDMSLSVLGALPGKIGAVFGTANTVEQAIKFESTSTRSFGDGIDILQSAPGDVTSPDFDAKAFEKRADDWANSHIEEIVKETNPVAGAIFSLMGVGSRNSDVSFVLASDAAALTGSAHGDRFYLGDGSTYFDGGAKSDYLFGMGGDDTLKGGADDDLLSGGDGVDKLNGGNGNDLLLGGNQNDILEGEDGNDNLSGGAGDDLLVGEKFSDGVNTSGGQVYRIYQATLDRAPDTGGFANWTDQLETGANTQLGVVSGFVASQEFQNVYGDLNDVDFVSLLYRNVLDRSADTAGLNGWLTLLSDGVNRSQVVIGFSESIEFKSSTGTVASTYVSALSGREQLQYLDDVFRLYRATLDREPDQGGLERWSSELGLRQDYTAIAAGFTSSIEFKNTYGLLDNAGFVNQLYRNVLDRAADTAGLNGWLGTIADGGSREDVVRGFAQSSEFISNTEDAFTSYMQSLGGDVFEGGVGNDTLYAGYKADTFIFDSAEDGTNIVLHIDVWDTIQFNSFGYSSYADVLAKMRVVGPDVRFADQGVEITFAGANQAAMEGIDYTFG